ncbi:twin-arginine translocation signal domain-containing protein [Candidatus Pacearchaeota archaeon]|jgi:hypothetical protein|nr:twin-arginine translocation signal domain-containing protein [Candidatus Pacearchaeota archaeon]
MNRRDFIKLSALAGAGLAFGRGLKLEGSPFAAKANTDQDLYCGWTHSEASRRRFINSSPKPFMNQMDAEIKGTGAGKVAILWPFLEKVTGKPLQPHNQEIGDCVSHAYGLGVDILTATQIVKRNSPQRWVAEAATEVIYGGSRIEIGKAIYNRSLYGDGAEGYWAAEFIKKYGVLLRKKYGDYDFTHYDGEVARNLGYKGVPTELEPLCKLHPVGWCALVQNWEEARDCVYNGYPVILCSNQGFNTKRGRDKDGYLMPGNRAWNHAMLLTGIDEACDRPGGCIQNSWGDFVSGGTKLNQPVGSFWADASVINRICAQGDTIAISSYAGYPRQTYDLF